MRESIIKENKKKDVLAGIKKHYDSIFEYFYLRQLRSNISLTMQTCYNIMQNSADNVFNEYCLHASFHSIITLTFKSKISS